MSNKVLFIDDDPSNLSTMKRNLGLNYDIHTAEGAESALQVVASQGAFPVVVVDMQMPKMNGIQTISLLRQNLPDTVFMMLTGNQDQETAIHAVNEGRVFRFLNKPCLVPEISDAIEAAQTQYSRITAEKELLSSTFSGAINLMTELIELPDHRNIDTGRMVESLNELGKRLSIEMGWEEKLAARIYLIGLAMLSPTEAGFFESLDATAEEHKKIFGRVCKSSALLVAKFPRLAWISELLATVPKAESYYATSERIEVSAVLLRVVFYWNFLTMKGFSVEMTKNTIQKIMPDLSKRLIEAMQCLPDNQDALILTNVRVSELQPGMIPHANLSVSGVGNLVSAGRRLTQQMIENIQRVPGLERTSLAVIAHSIPRS